MKGGLSVTIEGILIFPGMGFRHNQEFVRLGLVHAGKLQERMTVPCSAKTPSRLISLDFQVPEIHAPAMKILLMMAVAQFLTMVVFAWFNRGAWIRILALRRQVGAYKRKLQKPMLSWNERKTLLELGGSSGRRGNFGFSRTTALVVLLEINVLWPP